MSKPNILFVFTDEQRADTLGAYSSMSAHTPNLDKLASQSLLFENSYVTQPVCTPSRSSIMTGLYPHTNGCTANNIVLEQTFPTIAELWQDTEYHKGYFGKWHLGDEVFCQHGFDEWVSIEDMYRPHFTESRDCDTPSDYQIFLEEKGYKPDKEVEGYPAFSRTFAAGLPVEHTKPMFLAEETGRFIRRNKEDPFMLFVNFLEPHMPFTGPYNDRYPEEHVDLPSNFDDIPDNEPLHCRLKREIFQRYGYGGHDLRDTSGWKRIRGNYLGLVDLVDEAVGNILSVLEECSLDSNTIVVFTSDHGDMMGSHQLLTKCVMYEEAVKVPFIMRIPGTDPCRIPNPVSQVDLVPTLLELCGQDISSDLEGYSLLPCIQGDHPAEDHVFIEWNGPNRTELLRKDESISKEDIEAAAQHRGRTVISPLGWKLNWNEGDRHELYNLREDPGEAANLYYTGTYDDVIAQLKEKLMLWQERTKDVVIS
ncbi:sulfatase-like hydrolase/transferase [Planctomycetota bacterium]